MKKGEEHPEAVKLDDPEMAGLILSVSSTVRRKKTQKNLKNKTRNGKALQAMARQSFFLFLVFIVFL